MNLITQTFRSLVERKLWPVALVLVVALVAVPVVLSKAPTTPPPASPNASKTEAIPATFVSAAEQAQDAERRRVLGAVKDPFAPAPLKKTKAKKADKTTDDAPSQQTPTDEPKSSGGTGTGTGTGTGGQAPGGAPGGTAPPSATPAPAPTETVPEYSIKVRFGAVTETENLETKTIERLTPLPDEEAPVLVYRGVGDGGKVAIFELTGQVQAEGDGSCVPAPQDCQYLKLKAGETEFITVTETGEETDAQYQLDVVKIYKRATKVAKDSLESEAESLAKADAPRLDGGVKLRKRNRYVHDAATGTLRRARGHNASR